MEFLTRPENIREVIRYATRMPREGASRDQMHRYPFIASDVLTSSTRMAEALVPRKPVVEEVVEPVAVAEEEDTVDTTQAS